MAFFHLVLPGCTPSVRAYKPQPSSLLFQQPRSPQFRYRIFRGQVPRIFLSFLLTLLLFRFTRLVPPFYSLLFFFIEMFSKSFIAPIFLLALTSSVNAHAAIAPALGVKGNTTRSDVQRPSQAKPCGNINIAQNLDNSTAVNANAKGIFAANITGFDS